MLANCTYVVKSLAMAAVTATVSRAPQEKITVREKAMILEIPVALSQAKLRSGNRNFRWHRLPAVSAWPFSGPGGDYNIGHARAERTRSLGSACPGGG
jgi:hypothetical protein